MDWRYDVGVCTGPSNGYVYGGDEGRVLTFVRRERRAPGDSDIDIGIHRRIDGDIDTDINGGIEHGDIDTDFKDVDNVDLGGDNVNFGGLTGSPALSEVLRWAQESKRDGGVLSYEVTELEARRVTGVESGWECVLVANFGECFATGFAVVGHGVGVGGVSDGVGGEGGGVVVVVLAVMLVLLGLVMVVVVVVVVMVVMMVLLLMLVLGMVMVVVVLVTLVVVLLLLLLLSLRFEIGVILSVDGPDGQR